MGARHNRKRTRSRPRNHIPGSLVQAPRSFSVLSASSASSLSTSDPPGDLPTLPRQQTAMHWQHQWDQWQTRNRQHQQASASISTTAMAMRVQREKAEAHAAEIQRQQIFGGVKGDEVSLCPSMLQVVIGLFGGVDYEDP